MIGDFINRVLDITRPEPTKRVVGHTIPLSALESYEIDDRVAFKVGRTEAGAISPDPDSEMRAEQQQELIDLNSARNVLQKAIYNRLTMFGDVAYKKEKFKNTEECERHLVYDITEAIRSVIMSSEWAEYASRAAAYTFKYENGPGNQPFPNTANFNEIFTVERLSDDMIRICNDETVVRYVEEFFFTPIVEMIKIRYGQCLLDMTATSTHDGILYGVMVRV